VPWQNFVLVKPDLSDLIELVAYFRDHDEEAREIAGAGQKLANSMTEQAELDRCVSVVSKHLNLPFVTGRTQYWLKARHPGTTFWSGSEARRKPEMSRT
jgi:hypothetical protein